MDTIPLGGSRFLQGAYSKAIASFSDLGFTIQVHSQFNHPFTKKNLLTLTPPKEESKISLPMSKKSIQIGRETS